MIRIENDIKDKIRSGFEPEYEYWRGTMQLSKRLQTVAELVTPGNRVADVGCDHAYTSIYLAKKELSPHIIAMDINRGPIERARENIKRYGYESIIEVRRSDGLQLLQPGEADTILIAGMGGVLMRQILTNRSEVLAGTKELILQPQSELSLVRELLLSYGFYITAESMLIDEGKYYVCMKAEAGRGILNPGPYELTKKEHFYYGRLLLEQKHPVLREYLSREKQQLETIQTALAEVTTAQTLQRQKEILQELELVECGINYYGE